MREHFCQAADIGAATDWGDLYKHLPNQAEHIKTATAEDESRFNLDAVLKSLGILPDESVCVAWDPRRADVDRMAFADLSRPRVASFGLLPILPDAMWRRLFVVNTLLVGAVPTNAHADVTAHHTFRLPTWSYYLSLEDPLGAGADPLVLGDNFARWIAAKDGQLQVRIAAYGDKDFVIDVLGAPPPDEDLSNWDLVSETDVNFPNGHIFTSTGEGVGDSNTELFSLTAGRYRACRSPRGIGQFWG